MIPIKKLMMNALIFLFIQYCASKLTVLELLLKIAQYVSNEIILERLLAYMLFLVNASLPQVSSDSEGFNSLSATGVQCAPQ